MSEKSRFIKVIELNYFVDICWCCYLGKGAFRFIIYINGCTKCIYVIERNLFMFLYGQSKRPDENVKDC